MKTYILLIKGNEVIKKLLLTTLLFCTVNIFAQADWTIFTYIEASDQLQHEAIFNVIQMALGGIPETLFAQESLWLQFLQETLS